MTTEKSPSPRPSPIRWGEGEVRPIAGVGKVADSAVKRAEIRLCRVAVVRSGPGACAPVRADCEPQISCTAAPGASARS